MVVEKREEFKEFEEYKEYKEYKERESGGASRGACFASAFAKPTARQVARPW
jgi:hypothetical protein